MKPRAIRSINNGYQTAGSALSLHLRAVFGNPIRLALLFLAVGLLLLALDASWHHPSSAGRHEYSSPPIRISSTITTGDWEDRGHVLQTHGTSNAASEETGVRIESVSEY